MPLIPALRMTNVAKPGAKGQPQHIEEADAAKGPEEIELRTISSDAPGTPARGDEPPRVRESERLCDCLGGGRIEGIVREFARNHGLDSQVCLRGINEMKSTYDPKLALMDVTPAVELKVFLTHGCNLSAEAANNLMSTGPLGTIGGLDQLCQLQPKDIVFPVGTERSDAVSLASFMASHLMASSQHTGDTSKRRQDAKESYVPGPYDDQLGDVVLASQFFSKLLTGADIDSWRKKLLRRMTASWLQHNAIRLMVLKPKSTARTSSMGWHKRQVILTEGMFIYTTWGQCQVIESPRTYAVGSERTLWDPGLGPPPQRITVPDQICLRNGRVSSEPRYQLRGRLRIAANATVVDVPECRNPRGNYRNTDRGFGQGDTVFGIDFTPDPCGKARGEGLGATYRIFVTSEAERRWLKLAIELNISYVKHCLSKRVGEPWKKFAMSTETEYITSPGLLGQIWGWNAGEDIRGENRPSRARIEARRQQYQQQEGDKDGSVFFEESEVAACPGCDTAMRAPQRAQVLECSTCHRVFTAAEIWDKQKRHAEGPDERANDSVGSSCSEYEWVTDSGTETEE